MDLMTTVVALNLALAAPLNPAPAAPAAPVHAHHGGPIAPLAAGLSILSAPAIGLVAFSLAGPLGSMFGSTGSLVWPVGVALAPLATGLGQVYAGHPMRGLWVGLGAYPVTAAGFLVGAVPTYLTLPQSSGAGSLGTFLAPFIIGGVTGAVTLLGYSTWAGVDAYHLAGATDVR